jgi:hypothetical protein
LPDDKGAKVEDPRTVPVEKPRKRHVMVIRNGTQHEKAIFTEGDEDEDFSGSSDSSKKDTRDDKPAEKKEAPKQPAAKPADAGGPNPFGKSMRTKRIQ